MQADPSAETYPLPGDYSCHAPKFLPSSHLIRPLTLSPPQTLPLGPLKLLLYAQETDHYPLPLLCVLLRPPPSPAALSGHGCLVSHTLESGGGPMSSLLLTVSFRRYSSHPLPLVNTHPAI